MAVQTPAISRPRATGVPPLLAVMVAAATIVALVALAAQILGDRQADTVTASGAGGRTTAATDWSNYDPTYGAYRTALRGVVLPTIVSMAPDAGGRTSVATDWSHYNPAYGTYALVALDAGGRTSVATDWSHYNPAYGTYAVTDSDAAGQTSVATDWSHYNPAFGSYR